MKISFSTTKWRNLKKYILIKTVFFTKIGKVIVFLNQGKKCVTLLIKEQNLKFKTMFIT